MKWKINLHAGFGWVAFWDDDFPGRVFLRLEPDERGRWRVRDLVMRGEWRHIVPGDVRELNLAGMEEWAQEQVTRLAEEFAESDGPPVDWGGLDELSGYYPEEPKDAPRVPRLQRPTHGLTDGFLRHVADAYAQARRDRKHPAQELARQVGDGATERTIHKWVYVARKRGIMPPAARSRKKVEG